MKIRKNMLFTILYVILGLASVFTLFYPKGMNLWVNTYWKVYEPFVALIIISSIVVLSISKEKVKDNWLYMAIDFVCIVLALHSLWSLPSGEFGYILVSGINTVIAVVGIGYYFIRLVARD